MKYLCNDNWRFKLYSEGTGHDRILDDASSLTDDFSPVDIPHDWLIEDSKNLYKSSVGVYLRDFELDPGRHNEIIFDGVYMNTTVYLNGEKLLFWPYGYSAFQVDLDPAVKAGTNRLVVVVEHIPPNSRWYSGAGIYRDVYLNITEDLHLVTDSIYFNASLCDDTRFKIIIDTEVVANRRGYGDATVSHVLTDAEGRRVAESRSFIPVYSEPTVNTQFFYVENAHRWDINDPYLYNLTTFLVYDSCTIDIIQQRVGIRTLSFSPEAGMFLNGRHVKIKGVCLHHDLGCLGSAFNKNAARRQLEILKKTGVNSVRTSHNMPAKGFMELCDEMGILVDSEGFDMWEMCKNSMDYGRYFKEWCETDVRQWVRRDRNHPSLIMWSIGNEIPDTNNPGSEAIAKRLVNAVRRNDSRHNGFTTIGSNFVAWPPAQKSSDAVELSGYNYLESVYAEHHVKFPHWCIYGSETGSTVQSRGVYHFPKKNQLLTYDDRQCSSLDNCFTNWGARSIQKMLSDDRDCGYSTGQYIWAGWDYIGEPTPYDTKNSYFGHFDTCGFPKDTAYIIKAMWTDAENDAFVHITPSYWDFNPGQLIDVSLNTNAESAELFFNDESLGKKTTDTKHGEYFTAEWQLEYKPGILSAKAYDADGNIIATDMIRSFSDPASIKIDAEKTELNADGEDLIYLSLSVLDENGNEVANARNRMNVFVEGPARLLGMDNGDSTDYEQYKTNSRKLFYGKALAVIGATKEPGEVRIKVTSEGIPDAYLDVKAVPAVARDGISCQYSVNGEPESSEIPVRKITLLKSNELRILDADNPSIEIKAVISPENASYKDLAFKLITLDGIASNAAEIIVGDSPDAITLKAKGDGSFRLLCSCNNGSETPEVISELEFEVTGLGCPDLNPYEKIYGCQMASCSVPATLSFDGSMDIKQAGGEITFNDIDFGEYGSDELTVHFFTYADDEDWEVHEGGADGELLYSGTYHAKSIYNVLQPNTVKLSKRLKGRGSLTFILKRNFVFGGFEMTYFEKAYNLVGANEYNFITGDSFDAREDGIYAIGNNVDIQFDHMNFTGGVSAIEITGRSNIPSNPVHVRFNGKDGEIKKICEFAGSDEITTRTFPIEDFSGDGRINFIFMPGSDFDFVSFRFIK